MKEDEIGGIGYVTRVGEMETVHTNTFRKLEWKEVDTGLDGKAVIKTDF
jgi:hypothetical protein